MDNLGMGVFIWVFNKFLSFLKYLESNPLELYISSYDQCTEVCMPGTSCEKADDTTL